MFWIVTLALGIATLVTALIAARYCYKSSVVPVQECEAPIASIDDAPAQHVLTTDVNLIGVRAALNESSRLN